MGVTVKTADFAASTSNGTQDLTITGAGASGDFVAAIIMCSRAVSDGTQADHVAWSWGCTDGTRTQCSMAGNEDGVGSSNAAHSISSTSIVKMIDPTLTNPIGDTDYNATADFDSWITDGIRIDWTDAPPAAYRLHVILFNGTDIQAYADVRAVSDTVDVQSNVDDAGFQPNMILTSAGSTHVNENMIADAWLQVGGAYDTGSGTNHSCVMLHMDDGRSSARSATYSYSDCLTLQGTGGARADYIEVTEWRANGFGLTMRNSSDQHEFIYLALESSTNGMYLDHVQGAATGTGSKSFTGFGFKPQFVFIGCNPIQGLDTQDGSGVNCGSMGWGMFDGTNEHCLSASNDDGASIMDNQCSWHSNALFCTEEDKTVTMVDADFTSFDTDGYTLNYATNSLPLNYQLVWGIEEDAAATPGEPGHKAANRTRRAMNPMLAR